MTLLARPTPYSWSVGDDFTAAIGNNTRDALTWAQNPPVFLGTQGTVQSLTNSSWVEIGLDTTQLDPYTGHSNSTNNPRYVPNQPGWYMACGVVAFTVNATGARAARLQLNSAVIKGAAGMTQGVGGSNDCAITATVRPIYCNGTTDYISIAGWQGSGGALNTASDADLSSSLTVWWVHV
jgi:hypothetical protein